MITLIAFVVTLAILVIVHEFGHFQVARWCGVKVLKFSFGFGKPIYSKKLGKDQTEFLVSALPLGGYVKMLDERELNQDELRSYDEATLSRAFNRQAVWKRILIVMAGPAANLLLAIFLYWLLMMQGVVGIKPELGDINPESAAAHALFEDGQVISKIAAKPVSTWQDVQWVMLEKAIKSTSISIQTNNADNKIINHDLDLSGLSKDDFEGDFLSKLGLNPKQPKLPAIIGHVIDGSPAEKAGLRSGDVVARADGQAISDWQGLVAKIQQHPSQQLHLEIIRNKRFMSIDVTPNAIKESGQLRGQIGAALQVDEKLFASTLITTHYSPTEALLKAANKTWETSLFSLKMLANMLTGYVSVKTISGPVTIANYAGQSAHLGIKAFVGFLAMISISLGVLNLLPIPVLDGGHLLYYIVEIIKGSPVSDKTMEIGQRIGMFIIMLLMTCALYNDINRLIAG